MICETARATLGGRTVFVKTLPGAPPGLFAAEADGLRRIGAHVPVPDVLDVSEERLVLSWVEPGSPTREAAEGLGRALARLHGAREESFGGGSYVATLPLDPATGTDWPEWYATRRLLPYAAALAPDERRAVDAVVERIGSLAGPPEPPSPLHGDLWSGNVLWPPGGPAHLVDPAQHAGHRETDLAMLALFGAPYLDRVVAAYDEALPLADGWRDRVALHQLFPLLVHASLFGGGWGARAAAAARAALAA